jgi:hypothetical protein
MDWPVGNLCAVATWSGERDPMRFDGRPRIGLAGIGAIK